MLVDNKQFMDKFDIRIIIDDETYFHRKVTIEDMRDTDWESEMDGIISQAEYDNK